MTPSANRRAESAVRVLVLVTALLTLAAVVASVLVAPPARAHEPTPVASEMLEVSKDQSTWSPAPSAEVLAWTEPFEDISPGDTSSQQYYIRNVGTAPVRIDIAGLVRSLSDYSYLAVESTVEEVSGTVTGISGVGTRFLAGSGAAGIEQLTTDPALENEMLISGALLTPGSSVRVVNTVSLPAEVDRLPAEVKTRFMYQTTTLHLVPRASFDDRVASITVDQSGGTPAVVGSPVEFTISGDPADLVAGGTFVVLDADGAVIAREVADSDGTARFTHTFSRAGDQRITVRFEPAEGQKRIAPVTANVTVAKDTGGSGSSSGSLGGLGNLGWLFAVPVIVGVVAGIVGGFWILAHEARVPDVPHFPGAPPRPFAAGIAGEGPLAGLAGWFSPPAVSSGGTASHPATSHLTTGGGPTGNDGAGYAAVTGSIDTSQVALPPLPDARSWFTRATDAVRALFR